MKFSPFRHIAAAVALSLCAASAHASAYSQMVVFGDSLSDTGNIQSFIPLPLPPYSSNTISNGENWIEALGDRLGLSSLNSQAGGTNYAWAGATTGPTGAILPPFSLLDQANTYLSDTGMVADPDALYIIWGGGNDVRAGDFEDAASNVATIIDQLAAAGAQHFLINNLPDIGATPESLAGEAPGGTAEEMTQFTLQHNAALAAEVENFQNTTDLDVRLFDVFSLFNMLIGDPEFFGFVNATDVCWDGDFFGNGTQCADPDSYVFWDGIHPTEAAHAVLADFALSVVVPVPAALPLLLSGLGLLGFARRRTAG